MKPEIESTPARKGLLENCPACGVHRGHKAGCPVLAEEIANTSKGIFGPRPALDPANYTLEKYREFLRAKCNLPPEMGIPIEPGDLQIEYPPSEEFPQGFTLKPHQAASIIWGARGGRRALLF